MSRSEDFLQVRVTNKKKRKGAKDTQRAIVHVGQTDKPFGRTKQSEVAPSQHKPK